MTKNEITTILKSLDDEELAYIGGVAIVAGVTFSLEANPRMYKIGTRGCAGRYQDVEQIAHILSNDIIPYNESINYTKNAEYLRMKRWSDCNKFFE